MQTASFDETQGTPECVCEHRSSDRVITTNHEICCKSCGVILGLDNAQEVSTESIINLFQEVQPGCRPVKLEATMRIHEPRFASSAFSNACDKLSLPRYAALEAYSIFVKIGRTNKIQKQALGEKLNQIKTELLSTKFEDKMYILQKIQQAKKESSTLANCKIAMYSLFVVIRRFGILKSTNEICDAVGFAFSIKQLPRMLKVFSDVKPVAVELGINYDDEEHLEYWINIHLRNSQSQAILLTNEIKNMVRKTARTISGTDEAKARIAVRIVLAGLGVRNV